MKFGSEAWVLKKREDQRSEAAQVKFLRHLLGITKLDKEKNQCIGQKTGSTEHSKGNKTVPEKVATTCTENGHKQTTKTSTTILTKRRRNIGLPRNRWRDQLHLEDQGTGNTPNPSGT